MQVQALFSHGQLPISRHPLCRNPDSGQGANADKPQPGTEVRDAANAAQHCSKPLSKQNRNRTVMRLLWTCFPMAKPQQRGQCNKMKKEHFESYMQALGAINPEAGEVQEVFNSNCPPWPDMSHPNTPEGYLRELFAWAKGGTYEGDVNRVWTLKQGGSYELNVAEIERQELFTKDWPLPLSLPGVRWAIHSRICQKHGLNPREVSMQPPQPYAGPQPPADPPAIAAGVGAAGMHDAEMQAASGAGGPQGLPAHMPAQHGTSVRVQGTATRTRKARPMCGDDADGDRNETPAPRRAKRSKASYTHAPAHARSTLAGQAPRDEWAVAAREAEAVLQAQAMEVPVQAVAGCMPALHLQQCSFPAAADYLPQGPMPDPRVNFGEQLLPGAAAACLATEQAAKPVPAAAAAAGGWGGRIKIEGQPPRCKAEEEAESTETSGGSSSSSGGSSRGCSVPSLGTLRAAMEYNEAAGPVASDPNAPLFQVTMPGVPSTGAELLLPPGVNGKAACMGALERMLQPVSDDVAARGSAGLLGLEAISKREREDSDVDMPESAFGGLEGALDADDAGMQHVLLEAAGALLGAGLPGPQASLHTSQDVALAEPAAAVAVAEEPVPEQPVLKLLEMMASFCGAVLHEPEQGLHGGASPHARLLVHMLNALPRGELAQDGAMATELLHASERLVGLPRGALADRYWSASPHVSADEGHYSRCGSKAGSQNA